MRLAVFSLLGGLLLAGCPSGPGEQLGGALVPDTPPAQTRGSLATADVAASHGLCWRSVRDQGAAPPAA